MVTFATFFFFFQFKNNVLNYINLNPTPSYITIKIWWYFHKFILEDLIVLLLLFKKKNPP